MRGLAVPLAIMMVLVAAIAINLLAERRTVE